ncbi:MAG: sugar phosphate nucleotidyltransferase [Bacteroidota bacterium]
MNEPNIIILAGGISSRMKKSVASAAGLDNSLTQDAAQKSKSMIGVGLGQRPFLDYLLYNIQAAGYKDVVLLIGQNDTSVREYYEGSKRPGIFSALNMTFVVQPIPEGRTKPLGTADALQRSLEARPDWKSKQLTVCNSDNLYTIETLKLLLDSPERNAVINYDFQGLRFPRERIFQFAVLRTDPEEYLNDIMEKPSEEQLKEVGDHWGVSMNIFRFSYDDILPYLKTVRLHPERNEKELPETVRMMVRDKPQTVKTYRKSEYVPDLTTVDDIPQVQQYLLEHFSGVRFE